MSEETKMQWLEDAYVKQADKIKTLEADIDGLRVIARMAHQGVFTETTIHEFNEILAGKEAQEDE